jgi:DNA-binding XRE family transcriptional regulator
MAKKVQPAPHRILTPLPADLKSRQLRARAEALAERPAMTEVGRKIRAEMAAELLELQTIFQALKAEREGQGLSLADLAARTGMTREAISRLENGVRANPTIATVERYAKALGKHVVLQLVPATS